MIEINTDILRIEEGVILQEVNCNNHMTRGLNRSIARKYPIVKEVYDNHFTLYDPDELFGTLQKIKVKNKLYIFNSFSKSLHQETNAMNNSDHEKLLINIQKALDFAREKGLKLYIQEYIGCDGYGKDWSTFKEKLKQFPDDLIIVKMF